MGNISRDSIDSSIQYRSITLTMYAPGSCGISPSTHISPVGGSHGLGRFQR